MKVKQKLASSGPSQNAIVGGSSPLPRVFLGLAVLLVIIAMFVAPGRPLQGLAQGSPDTATVAQAVKAIEDTRASLDPSMQLSRLGPEAAAKLAEAISPLADLDAGQVSERAARAFLLAQSVRELSNQLAQMSLTERAVATFLAPRAPANVLEWKWEEFEALQPTLSRAVARGNVSLADDLARFHESMTNALAIRQELLLRSDFDWRLPGAQTRHGATASLPDFLLGMAIVMLVGAGFMSRANPTRVMKVEPAVGLVKPQATPMIDLADLESIAEKIKTVKLQIQGAASPQRNNSETLGASLAALVSAEKIAQEISKAYDAGTHQENLVYDFARIAELIAISSGALKELASQKNEPDQSPFAAVSSEIEAIAGRFEALKDSYKHWLDGIEGAKA
jgi:hypothetical protein